MTKKLVLLGDNYCGKSVLLVKMSSGKYEHQDVTIGVAFAILTDKNNKIQCWDTAGHECYRSITNSHLRGSSLIVITYDCTRAETLDPSANYWVQCVHQYGDPNTPIILVGTKADVRNHYCVSLESALEKANQLGCSAVIETSALEDVNVQTLCSMMFSLLFPAPDMEKIDPELIYVHSYVNPNIRIRYKRKPLTKFSEESFTSYSLTPTNTSPEIRNVDPTFDLLFVEKQSRNKFNQTIKPYYSLISPRLGSCCSLCLINPVNTKMLKCPHSYACDTCLKANIKMCCMECLELEEL